MQSVVVATSTESPQTCRMTRFWGSLMSIRRRGAIITLLQASIVDVSVAGRDLVLFPLTSVLLGLEDVGRS